MELSWRDIAAIWGAGLSTFLALTKLLPSKPMFHLEPGDPPSSDLTLRIMNPGKRMLIVRERFRWRIAGAEDVLGIFTERSRLDQMGVPGTLVVAVPSEGETLVSINCLSRRVGAEADSQWLLVFAWSAGWLLPLSIPALVYVSSKRARELDAASKGAP